MSSPRASKRRRTRLSEEPSLSPSSATTTTTTPATSCSSPIPSSSSSTSKPAPLRRFLSWCDSQGISIDPRLDFGYTQFTPNSWSISIHASHPIPTDTVIVTIPKTAVLSRKTSALSPILHSHPSFLSDNPETVGLELALCLLYERLLHSQSRFYPFLSILPRLPLPLPFLQSPLKPWLSGTETCRINTRASTSYHLFHTDENWIWDQDFGMSHSKALDYFHTIAIPILRKSKLFGKDEAQHLQGLERKFLTCYTHVSSRDFIVDTWHGVGLVPVAELFNHAEVNTVQFESDQEVCEFCGRALIGGHDQKICTAGKGSDVGDTNSDLDADTDVDDEEENKSTQGEEDQDKAETEQEAKGEEGKEQVAKPHDQGVEEDEDEQVDIDDTLELRTLTPHQPGEEIYNTYGPLTNPLLLTRYGFCLDTETDFERYTLDLRFPVERRSFLDAFTSCSDPNFTRGIKQVEGCFWGVLDWVNAKFPPKEDEEEGEGEGEKLTAIDKLHHLSTLFPPHFSLPPTLSAILTPLITPNHTEEVDQDLVDRDQLQPLYLNSTGQISIPFFILIYLIRISLSSPSHSSFNPEKFEIKVEDHTVQATLKTLQAFYTYRLQALHISKNLEEALQLLSPKVKVEYITKASIQQAYQEYASLTSVISSLKDLIITL